MRKIVFLGTGYGMPKYSATTSMLLVAPNTNLLIDCAGGHEIIGRLHQSGHDPKTLKNIFISHTDSDHLLGIVPLMRVIKKHEHSINLICSQRTYDAIESIFAIMAHKHWLHAQANLNVKIVKDGDSICIDDLNLSFIETGSKVPMLGIRVDFADHYSLFCPGDEPINPGYFDRIQNLDLLIHEAFCLNRDIEKYDPRSKMHSTVREAALLANAIKAKKLALIHMEDDTLATRKAEYGREVSEVFGGEIFVPVDLDEIQF